MTQILAGVLLVIIIVGLPIALQKFGSPGGNTNNDMVLVPCKEHKPCSKCGARCFKMFFHKH